MTAVCPQGHTSSTDDFCDVCGTPIGPTATVASVPSGVAPTPPTPPAPPTPPVPPGAPPKLCPNCDAANAPDALFCEDCGYDFATGQLPPPPATVDPVSGIVVPPAAAPPAPAKLSGVDWVAEIWVDPDWFTHQDAEGSCPTSGMPTVVPLKGSTLLIGRLSRSRNINPEIDCSGDGAISHRHAELNRTGDRWSVTDLGSTNGTYVGDPGGTYPKDALPPHRPRELADDERIYLGAWTRIVVRRATDAEKAGTTS
jgi:hypothetical protein